MNQGYVHSIESCGTVDGPGVRYVIFLSGCPLRCQYCHNPDTWEYGTGSQMSVSEVLEGFYTNLPFYQTGGVTVTGGEPLMQIDFVTAVFRELKSQDIHTCIDTSGAVFAPDSPGFLTKLDKLLTLTDLILLDLKHMNDAAHRSLTGQSNRQILAFARYLNQKRIPVWVRHVIIPGVTLYREYLEELGIFMAGLDNLQALEVLPYHSMGKAKYESLGIPYPLESVREPSAEEAAAARQIILSAYQKEKERLYSI